MLPSKFKVFWTPFLIPINLFIRILKNTLLEAPLKGFNGNTDEHVCVTQGL